MRPAEGWVVATGVVGSSSHHDIANALVNVTEDVEYKDGDHPVEVRSVAIPPVYEACTEPSYQGAFRQLGNPAGITGHLAQLVFQKQNTQVGDGCEWIQVGKQTNRTLRRNAAQMSHGAAMSHGESCKT